MNTLTVAERNVMPQVKKIEGPYNSEKSIKGSNASYKAIKGSIAVRKPKSVHGLACMASIKPSAIQWLVKTPYRATVSG